MNHLSQPDPQPFGGLLLHGPLQLAFAQTICWSCKKLTKVVAIIAADVEEFEEGTSMGSIEAASFVYDIEEEEMPDELVQALSVFAPHYGPIYSQTMGESTWANACEHCGGLQGAFYQHSELDGPFLGGPDEFKGVRIDLLLHSIAVSSASYSV